MKAWEGVEADARIAELGGTLVDTATRATSLREALIRVSAASRTAQDEAGQADRTMAESEARAVVREMVPLVTALEALNQQLDGFRDRLGPSPAPPAAAGVGGRAGPHGACALGLAVLALRGGSSVNCGSVGTHTCFFPTGHSPTAIWVSYSALFWRCTLERRVYTVRCRLLHSTAMAVIVRCSVIPLILTFCRFVVLVVLVVRFGGRPVRRRTSRTKRG